MTDIVSPTTRSRMMSNIRSKDTKPERLVRSLLHRRGLRFARTSSGLPGRPDAVLPRWKVVVFVNGCFWHMHECGLFKMPSNNREFWAKKLNTNRNRDKKNIQALLDDGWKVLTIWECAIRGTEALSSLEKNMNRAAEWIRSKNEKNYCVLCGAGLTEHKDGNEGN